MARHLKRLIERGEVEALELCWAKRRGGLRRVRVYRITPKGLEALEHSPPPEVGKLRRKTQLRRKTRPRAPSLPAPSPEWEPPEGSDPLRLALWVAGWSGGKRALRILLHLHSRPNNEDSWYGLKLAASGYRYPAGDDVLRFTLLRFRELGLLERAPAPSGQYRFRLTERGRKVVEAILALRAELGIGAETRAEASSPPRAADRGDTPSRDEAENPLARRGPRELLEVLSDGALWTLSALAKATGRDEGTVKRRVRQLIEQGLVEAVELRKTSRRHKTVTTVHVYRRAIGSSAAAERGAQRIEFRASRRPDLDILAAMCDGALWTRSALSTATRHEERTVKWHLRRLIELGLVEAVEVRMARWGKPGFARVRLPHHTQRFRGAGARTAAATAARAPRVGAPQQRGPSEPSALGDGVERAGSTHLAPPRVCTRRQLAWGGARRQRLPLSN